MSAAVNCLELDRLKLLVCGESFSGEFVGGLSWKRRVFVLARISQIQAQAKKVQFCRCSSSAGLQSDGWEHG